MCAKFLKCFKGNKIKFKGLDQLRGLQYAPKPVMPGKNKYIKRSRISEAKFRQFSQSFLANSEHDPPAACRGDECVPKPIGL